MGLTNGSRRPCAPNDLADGFGFSAVWAGTVFCAVPVAGALAGTCTPGFAEDLVWLPDAFFTGATGFTAITAGAFAGVAFLVPAFLGSIFLAAFELLLSLAATTGVGAPFDWVPAAVLVFTGSVVVFTAGLPVAADEAPLFGDGSALGVAALLLDVFVAVPGAALAPLSWTLLAAFFAAGFFVPAVLPAAVLPATAGVGDGVGWLLAPEFCAVATVAMAVASARICISFISIPFCAPFILKLFTASPLAQEPVDPASAALGPVALPVHD